MEVKTLAIEVNGVRFNWAAKDDRLGLDLFKCPFNRCDGACQYWNVVDGVDGYVCYKDTIIESCVVVED